MCIRDRVEQGITSNTKGAIGEWVTGAEPSVMTEITQPIDQETLDYIGAIKGLLGRQLEVLSFKSDPKGKDFVHIIELDARLENIDVIMDRLTKQGLEYKTLPISGNKFDLVVVDFSGKLVNLVEEIANEEKKEIKRTRGRASSTGAYSSRQRADREYLRIIEAYELGRGQYSKVLRDRLSVLRPRFDKSQLPKKQKQKKTSYQLEPVFYSTATKAVESIQEKSLKARGVLNHLRRHGTRSEEIEALGIKEWLASFKPTQSIPKEDLLNFMHANEIRIEDKVRGGTDAKYNTSSITLPGGEDYREIQLMLPLNKDFARVNPTKDGEFEVRGENNILLGTYSTEELANEFVKELHQTLSQSGSFIGGHFGEDPNTLAHIRFNTRYINGKKVLFIEEIQSDWHQTGRKEGYQKPMPSSVLDRYNKLRVDILGVDYETVSDVKLSIATGFETDQNVIDMMDEINTVSYTHLTLPTILRV